jgi:hypothetical protein
MGGRCPQRKQCGLLSLCLLSCFSFFFFIYFLNCPQPKEAGAVLISRQGQGKTVLKPGLIRRELGRVSSSVAGRSPTLELLLEGHYFSGTSYNPRDEVWSLAM